MKGLRQLNPIHLHNDLNKDFHKKKYPEEHKRVIKTYEIIILQKVILGNRIKKYRLLK